MPDTSATLTEMVSARLISRFRMQPGGIRRPHEFGDATRFASREYDLELLLVPESGKLLLQSLTDDGSWQLVLRAIGSAQNWLTAELITDGLPDDGLLARLHLIDRVLDGVLARAFRARRELLDQRATMLREQTLRAQRERDRAGVMADLFAPGGGNPALFPHHADSLAQFWMQWPGVQSAAEPALATEDPAGSAATGFRFYLECIVHARNLDDAALSLADELFLALADNTLTASVEPLGDTGELLERQLDHCARLASLTVAGLPGLAVSPDCA